MSLRCKEIENIINKIFTKPKEIDEFNVTESKTFLSLYQLIDPNSSRRKKTKPNPPRAQNGEICNFKLWKNINVYEIKTIYDKVSEIAKRVHGNLFPNYRYSPKRKCLNGLNLLFQKHISHYVPYNYAPYNYIQHLDINSASYYAPYNIQQLDINSASNYKPCYYIQQLDINLKNFTNETINNHQKNMLKLFELCK
ncbi:18958_t:CDS:2 [Racocetra fulgida]|uniref:18958_t:CDS:1 n=1 Tax=Racocetra fulgida TaxID=60492 RepID=A0A9N9AXK3_9GLOM|nr:18958_t:CDS:2 [Racocetra fulgida]